MFKPCLLSTFLTSAIVLSPAAMAGPSFIDAPYQPFVSVETGGEKPDTYLKAYKAYEAARNSGDVKAAVTHAQQAVKLAEKALGDQHQTVLMLKINLLDIASQSISTKPDRFVSELETIPKRAAAVFGEFSPNHITAERAALAIESNHFAAEAKAINRVKRLVDAAEKAETPNPALIASLQIDAGATFYKVGRGKIGLRYLNKAHDFYAQYESDAAVVARARVNLWRARIEKQRSREKNALKYLNDTISVFEKYAPNSQQTMNAHAMAVGLYEELGLSDKATEHCRAIASVQPGNADQGERPVYMVAPDYPKSPAGRYQEGVVSLTFDIDDAGFVTNIRVTENTAGSAISKSVKKALTQYRYIPGFKDGKAVPVEGLRYKFVFHGEG